MSTARALRHVDVAFRPLGGRDDNRGTGPILMTAQLGKTRPLLGLPRPRRRCGRGNLRSPAPALAAATPRRRQGGGDHRRRRRSPESDLGAAAQAFGDQLQRRSRPSSSARRCIDVLIDIRLIAKAAETAGLDKSKDVAPKLAFARDQTLRSEYLQVEGRRRRHRRRGQEALRRGDRQVRRRATKSMSVTFSSRPRTRPRRSSPSSTRAATSPRSPRRSRSIPVRRRRAAISASSAKGKTVKPFEDAAFALDVGTYTKAPVQIPVRLARHQGRRRSASSRRRPSRPQADRIRQQLARETVTNEIRDAARRGQDRDRAGSTAGRGRARRLRPTPAPSDPAAPAQPAARCSTGAMSAVSPLAPKAYAELPPIAGVRFATAEAGIKYKNRTDVLLVVFDKGTEVAGVFTRSKCPSAPVDWCRAALAKRARRGRSSSTRATPTPSPASAAARRSSCPPAWSPRRSAAGRRRSSSPRPA